ncbi:MAG TPA: phosphoglycerate dehydrogenase [Ruminococcaceae bacterium]|nr:phosphoglycerate dehydrogenase [Oscillospiraceae bacterium]
MKSLFLGQPHRVEKVYPEWIKKTLEIEAGLEGPCITWPCSADDAERLKSADFIFSTWGMPSLSREEIDEFLPNVKAVFYAAGTVQAFARPFLEKGVRVFSAWAANGVPVAEFTLAHILLAGKNAYAAKRMYTRHNRFKEGSELVQRTGGNFRNKVGIIGAGMIGSMVIEKLKDFEIDVYVSDPFLPDEKAKSMGVTKVSLEEIFKTCRVISNHLANNDQTKGILNYSLFSTMLQDAVFINTGRGAQVVEPDLCNILKGRTDITAVLDVTYPEPLPDGHPFFTLPNVILTPHIAGSMGREVERMSQYMLEEYRRYIKGDTARYDVTLDMLKTMA